MRLLALTTAAALAGLVTASASAGLIYEPFLSGNTPANGEYADAAPLKTANPTVTGYTDAWGGTNTQRLDTTSAGLTYTAGSISLGSGGSAIRGTNTSTGTQNTTRVANGTTVSGTTVSGEEAWFAFLINMGSVAANESLTANFTLDSSVINMNAGIADGNLKLQGVTMGAAVANTTYLMMARLDIPGGNGAIESVQYWINPTDSSSIAQLTATALYTYTTVDGNYVHGSWGYNNLTLIVTGAHTSGNRIDEIMVGSTLADLNSVLVSTSIPEPASLALLAMGGLLILGRRRP